MITRIIKLLNAWESLMQSEQKAFELNIKAFELSIEREQNSKKMEIIRLELQKKHLSEKDKTREEMIDLEYTEKSLEILKKGNY